MNKFDNCSNNFLFYLLKEKDIMKEFGKNFINRNEEVHMKKSSRRIASALLSMAVAAASLPMNALGMPMIRLASDENIPGGG